MKHKRKLLVSIVFDLTTHNTAFEAPSIGMFEENDTFYAVIRHGWNTYTTPAQPIENIKNINSTPLYLKKLFLDRVPDYTHSFTWTDDTYHMTDRYRDLMVIYS